MANMKRLTTRSGYDDGKRAVITLATMIAMFASASFRADRNAARVKLPDGNGIGRAGARGKG
jgi:hypothetical protein